MDLCARCRVPRILMANACEHMILEARVNSGFLGLRRRVVITAFCTRSMQDVEEPEIGCPQCHLGLEDLALSPEDS